MQNTGETLLKNFKFTLSINMSEVILVSFIDSSTKLIVYCQNNGIYFKNTDVRDLLIDIIFKIEDIIKSKNMIKKSINIVKEFIVNATKIGIEFDSEDVKLCIVGFLLKMHNINNLSELRIMTKKLQSLIKSIKESGISLKSITFIEEYLNKINNNKFQNNEFNSLFSKLHLYYNELFKKYSKKIKIFIFVNAEFSLNIDILTELNILSNSLVHNVTTPDNVIPELNTDGIKILTKLSNIIDSYKGVIEAKANSVNPCYNCAEEAQEMKMNEYIKNYFKDHSANITIGSNNEGNKFINIYNNKNRTIGFVFFANSLCILGDLESFELESCASNTRINYSNAKDFIALLEIMADIKLYLRNEALDLNLTNQNNQGIKRGNIFDETDIAEFSTMKKKLRL